MGIGQLGDLWDNNRTSNESGDATNTATPPPPPPPPSTTTTTTTTTATGIVNPAYSCEDDNADSTSSGSSTNPSTATTSSSTCSAARLRQLRKSLQRTGPSELVLNASRLLRAGCVVSGGGLQGTGSVSSLPTRRSKLSLRLFQRQQNTGEENADDALTAEEMVVVERPILTEFDFEQGFEKTEKPRRTPLTWAKKRSSRCECSRACVKAFVLQVLPFLRILRGYSITSDLPSDIVAGLTVGIMHIPQGMAYGQLSTLPPVFGLYVSFFPVILYFFLGTSKHVSIGTFAVVSLMVGSVVDKGLAAKGITLASWNETVVTNGTVSYQLLDNSAEVLQAKLSLAMAVTFAVGCIQLLLSILRLGFLTVYLSDPLVSGFTTGAACHVFTSQIKHLFGLEIGRYYGPFKLIYSYRDFFSNLPTTNSVTLIASLVCIVLLVVVKEYINNNPKIKPKLKMPIPVELIVVVLGTVISHFVKLEETYSIKIVGDVPVGIPAPKVQQFTYLSDVVSDAIALGIVAFAISVSMAKILAKKHDYDIDPNQELLAYGLINVTCSFFSSFCAAASLSRSLVQDNVGGKTQVAGLVSSALLLVVLLVLGSYFKSLPNCILAAIIVVALKGMFKQFAELKRLWNISLIDFMVWLIAFLATVLLDVDLGLMVGIIFALLTVIIRHQRPHACLLGQVPGTDLYKDMGSFKAAEALEHIKIFRFESALFFANSEYFKTSFYKLTADPVVLKKLKRRAEKELQKVQVMLCKNTLPALEAKVEEETETDGAKSTDVAVLTSSEDPSSPADSGVEDTAQTQSLEEEDAEDFAIVLPTVTDVYFIIIDCTTMSYVDSVGVKVLQQVITEMRSYSIQVFLAHCKAAVREMFEKTDFHNTSDKECLFLTVHDAVLYAQRLLAIVEAERDGESKASLDSIQEHDTPCSTKEKMKCDDDGSLEEITKM